MRPYVFSNQIALLLSMKGFLVRATVSLQAFKDNLRSQTLFIGHRMVHGLSLSVRMPMFKDKASMSDDIPSMSKDRASMSDDIRSLSSGIQSMSYDIRSMPDDSASISYDISPLFEDTGSMAHDIASMFNVIHSTSDDKGAMSKDISSSFEDIDSLSDDIAFHRALSVPNPLVRHTVRHFLLYLLLQ